MKRFVSALFRFLPVQLLFLHFRKYQLLLVFWLVLTLTLTGDFAAHFGASTLFLAPEYLGEISFTSMFLLGGATAVFIMSWHITTFIIHSHRMPFMGATRQAFLKYCVNNALLPLAFLVFYSVVTVRFQWYNEHMPLEKVILLQAGFYLGVVLLVAVSFAYFFRVDRNLLKIVIATIANPSPIREIIPYDTLDYEYDLIRAETYLSERLGLRRIRELEAYPPRVLSTVLRRHHRNAVTAFLFSVVTLLVLGVFMDEPVLRIPAGAGFMILFALLTGMVGAVKYFLRSWELLGWIILAVVLSLLVQYQVFDLRSIAYGLNYRTAKTEVPVYDYTALRRVFTPERYQRDRELGLQRLDRWRQRRMAAGDTKPPVIVIGVSGGGSRAAYWTFRTLQYLDSVSQGRLFSNTVLITGASGGMLGAAYWRSIHKAHQEGRIADPYDPRHQEHIGRDLLNAIVFSFVSVDLISPFNKIPVAGYGYTRDRGYAMEQELVRNTEGLLDQRLGDFRVAETAGRIPALIVNGTIVNDGRRLMMSALPVSYLTQPSYAIRDSFSPPVDAVDFVTFFSKQNPYNLRLTSALRMSASFPFILPVVKLPSIPQMNIMDAGLRDNFGTEVANRYLFVFRDWLKKYAGNVVYIQIRDTRESEAAVPSQQNTLIRMLTDPLFVIQDKWAPIQSYYAGDIRDIAAYAFDGQLKYVTLEYIPVTTDKPAPLNFHLTQKERADLYRSIYQEQNKAAVESLLRLLK
jgi:hypothetical protein